MKGIRLWHILVFASAAAVAYVAGNKPLRDELKRAYEREKFYLWETRDNWFADPKP